MWWYKILGDNKRSISHLLRLYPITAESILLTVKFVSLKRENYNYHFNSEKNRIEEIIDYFGLSIEVDTSRVGKKGIYISILDIHQDLHL